MKTSLQLLVFGCLIILSACSYPEEVQEIKKDSFHIAIPGYMKTTEGLRPGSSVEAFNKYRNIYTFVVEQEKGDESFADFHKKSTDLLKGYDLLEMPLVTDSLFEKTETGKEIHLEIYGVIQDENIYYWHSSYETADKYYEVVVWTRSMDRKQRYGADIQAIIDSFKPL